MKCCKPGPWCLAVADFEPLTSGSIVEWSTTVLPLLAKLVFNQGILTEGEVSVQLTSLYLLVSSAPFNIENIIFLCYITSYLNEEDNCTEHSLLISVPWFNH